MPLPICATRVESEEEGSCARAFPDYGSALVTMYNFDQAICPS